MDMLSHSYQVVGLCFLDLCRHQSPIHQQGNLLRQSLPIAKRAAGKGVNTATDSALGGASMTDAAKTGGDAALKEAMGSSPTE